MKEEVSEAIRLGVSLIALALIVASIMSTVITGKTLGANFINTIEYVAEDSSASD